MTGLSLTAGKPDLGQLLNQIATSRWTPVVVNLAALVLLAYSLAQWTWRLMTPASPPVTAAVQSPVQDNATALRELLAANLFGAVAPGQGGFSPDTLPLTSLNLVLTGVMVRGQQDSFALIKIDGAEEEPVVIGQEITAGARLHAVYPDRAVLTRGGAYESLILKESAAALAPGSIVSSAPHANDFSNVVRGSGNQFTVNRQSMVQQMQRPEFLSQALIVPNAGGGFLVREVQPGSIYEKLGVRVGDVIRGVNGQPVNNMDDVMKMYQQLGGLQASGNVAIEVTRAGRSENLNYQLD